MLALLNLTPAELTLCCVAIFIAAIVRGYSGFGFSALTVASISFILPPAEIVPIILLIEVAASLSLLPSVWREANYRAIAWLGLGYAVGFPIGNYFLRTVPADTARIAISILILGFSLTILLGKTFNGAANNTTTTGTGLISGIVNGIAGIGGLPVILFFLASEAAATMTRATIIAFFLFTDTYATIYNIATGILTPTSWVRFAIFLIPLWGGLFIGNRQFVSTTPGSFKKMALILLIFLSVLGLARTILG